MILSISFSVPALSDTDIWFANAAAWSNYWAGVSGTATMSPIAVSTYTASAYNTALEPAVMNIGGVDYVLVTQAMLNSLLTRVDTLNASYEALRSELIAGGLIVE